MPNYNLDEYGNWLEQERRSPFTKRGYVLDLMAFARWLNGDNGRFVSPEFLNESIVLRYRDYLIKEKGVSARTYNRKLAAIRSYVAWAQKAGKLESDPLQRLQMIREERVGPCWLKGREVRRLRRIANRAITQAQSKLDHTLAVRDKSVFIMFLNTGMRLAELCALDLMDVRLGSRSGKIHVLGGGGLSEGELPLNKEVHSILRDWIKRRPEKDNSWAIFVGTRSGRRMVPRSVQARMSLLGQRANVYVTPHILRHTYARNLIDGGVNTEKVVKLLGQHDLCYTARTYNASTDQGKVKTSENQA